MANSLDRLLSPRLRAAALMPAAVLTVHQLRFLLAFGGSSGEELEKEGHQYLSALAAPIAMSVAIVVGLFFARLASAWREGAGEATTAPGGAPGDSAPRGSGAGDPGSWRGFLRLALLIGASLLALYSCQELLEGMLSSGHPEGFDGVFGDGGWWAAPLSLACGFVVAAALRGARAAIRWAASHHRRPTTSHGRPAPAPRPRRPALPRPVPLAGAAAGRAPPLAS
ncbi:MAG TPA: hypothetical protein VHA76_05420 [Solirubrobacterales bacterium]|nr:hypothetical protein [Solirubrobacterales bacterium]